MSLRLRVACSPEVTYVVQFSLPRLLVIRTYAGYRLLCIMGSHMPESIDYIAEEEMSVQRKAWLGKATSFRSRVRDRT